MAEMLTPDDCVGGDVKPCTITVTISRHIWV